MVALPRYSAGCYLDTTAHWRCLFAARLTRNGVVADIAAEFENPLLAGSRMTRRNNPLFT
jgi:hypothetical protein